MFTEKCEVASESEEGKRKEIKNVIKSLKLIYPNIDVNIFRCVENVNLDAIVAYKTKGHKNSFLDKY